jgi:hypothetical protein
LLVEEVVARVVENYVQKHIPATSNAITLESHTYMEASQD